MALFGIALSLAALLRGAVSPTDKPDPASEVAVRFYDLVGVPAETILAMQATTAAGSSRCLTAAWGGRCRRS